MGLENAFCRAVNKFNNISLQRKFFLLTLVLAAYATVTCVLIFVLYTSGLRIVLVPVDTISNSKESINQLGKVKTVLKTAQNKSTPFIVPSEMGNKSLPTDPVKIFLVWGYWSYSLPRQVPDCPYKCGGTRNVKLIDKADAVVFYGWNLPNTTMPKYRHPNQRWIYMLNESPRTTKVLKKDLNYLKLYNNVFNWTMTYRKDSDINIRFWKFQSKPTTSRLNYARNKTKFAVSVVSNCEFKERLRLIEEIQKYVPVDLYGKCGNKSCGDKKRCDVNITDYKFLLSFENSFYCKDYITEKFYSQALMNNAVSIAKGPVKQEYLTNVPNFPAKSFIHVDDFKSIKLLTNYLIELNKSDSAYNEYHEWRRSYELVDKKDMWCKLCEKLHTDTKPKVYNDLYSWFDSCKNMTI